MVDEALEPRIQPLGYHPIDGGVDGDRPVTAVAVLQAAGERPLFEIDSVQRHPGQLVYAPSGVTVNKHCIHERDVLVLPEQRQLLPGDHRLPW